MKVFLTGISGTLGTAVARLHHQLGDEVYGVSRSESKIVQWLQQNKGVATVYSCDVCNLDNPKLEATQKLVRCDRCYHLAALKHVDLCQRQPDEALFQNVYRTTVVAEMCQLFGIPLIFVSSDKACLPENVYGCTKYLAEVEVLRRGGSVVRLGNIIGSSGSVFQLWKQSAINREEILVTDKEMTRFFLPVEEAASFLVERSMPGYIVAPFLKSIRMGDVANKVASMYNTSIKEVGSRPGESRHQWIFPPGAQLRVDPKRYVLTHEGGRWVHGIHSADKHVERWDINALLQVAGILI